ncbi:MAG: hypothetical protein Q4A26_01805 [Candidatus Saccharibacteria bacterium]|nr:hypothetical protein [Candidatus Saccharibacteria bacterium]
MDILGKLKGRNITSSILHILFNAVFATMVFLAINIGGQIEVALILILVSKWRIFAVRSRYWGVNILANLVDIVVGFGMVGLIYLAGAIQGQLGFWTQISITLLYAIWLIVIKPLSGKKAARIQSGISLFVGTWVVMAVAHNFSSIPFLVESLLFIIGYSSARHVLSTHKEEQVQILSLIFGLIVAEIGWLASHWTIGYEFYLSSAFKLPQVAIIITLLGLISERFYSSTRTGRSIWSSEYSAPVLFSVLAIIVMLIYFSSAVSI